MNKLFKILTFFRIIDLNDQLISITSIAMYVSLYRLLTVPQAGYTEVGTMITTLAAYSYKKVINKDIATNQKGNNDIS